MSGAPRRLRVAVVFGGRSTEHSISCVSAGSVLAVLDRARYDVVPVGITPQGRWVLEADDPQRLAIRDGRLPSVDGGRTALVLPADPTRGPLAASGTDGRLGDAAFDVVFPLLHGPYGEDGTIQGLLEMAGVPYVGSGVLASAVAMDKEYMKLLLAARGLPVAPYEVLGEDLDAGARAAVARRARERLTLPVFVKPARGGSSIGITRVDDWADLDVAVEEARGADPKVLVEQGVTPAREVECGVLDADTEGGAPQASLPAEVRVHGRAFYDFTAKYLDDGGTEFDVPAQLSAQVTTEVQRLSVAAFEALGCRGLARVDFFVRPDGTLVVNELNTMPGFTPASMFPRMWAASGLDYAALVERLLTSALRARGRPSAGSAGPR